MAASAHPPPSPLRSVSYGPFPVLWGWLVAAAVPLLVCVAIVFFAFSHDHLRCTPNEDCVVTHFPVPERRVIPMAELREARVEIDPLLRRGVNARVVLVPTRGDELRLVRTSKPEAEEVAAEVRAGLAGHHAVDTSVYGPRSLLLPGVAPLVLALIAARAGLKNLGRLRLTLTRNGAALRVQRVIFGLPIATREVDLRDAVEVRVEGGTVLEMWFSRRSELPGARLLLVDREGQARPVTEGFLPGEAVHSLAASELRALLGLARV